MRVIHRLAALSEGEQRHYEAGRAKAALGCVGVHHCLLDRVERAVGRCQPFDRQHGAAVELRKHHEAGVHRMVAEGAIVGTADCDRARATVAFRTTFLGAGEARHRPQPIEHGHGRRRAGLGARLTVQ